MKLIIIFLVLLLPLGSNAYEFNGEYKTIMYNTGNTVFVDEPDYYISVHPHTISAKNDNIAINYTIKRTCKSVDILLGFENGANATLSNECAKYTRYDHGGKNTWVKIEKQKCTKNIKYSIIVNLNINDSRIGKQKYDIAIKPSEYTIEQAINKNMFYILDPWYNSGQIYPNGHIVCDANWNGVSGGGADASLVFASMCFAKPPAIFDPLNSYQFDSVGKIFGRMNGASTVRVFNSKTGVEETLLSNTCTQLGVSGIYYWNTLNLATQPIINTEYFYNMSSGWRSFGKFIIGSSRKGNAYGDETVLLGLLRSGKTVSIELWDYVGNSIPLNSNLCIEHHNDDMAAIYGWNTNSITIQPIVETYYVYKMTCAGDSYTGCFGLQTVAGGSVSETLNIHDYKNHKYYRIVTNPLNCTILRYKQHVGTNIIRPVKRSKK